MYKPFFVALLAMALLSGCVSVPMTPAEFRAEAKVNKSITNAYTVESFEVNRSFAEVAATFAKKAPECLNFELTATQRGNLFGSNTHTYAIAKHKLQLTATKAELTFQLKPVAKSLTALPDDGVYYVVADAYPAGKGKTKVDIYNYQVKLALPAIKGWATGENMGCPDPLRMF